MAEFLLELFSEEIPARMQARAAEDLKSLVTDALKTVGLAFDRAEAFVTPRRLALPAYDQCLKAGHNFNLLDARGVISVVERAAYIGRVRDLARACCRLWLDAA